MAIRKQEIQRKMDEIYSLLLREDKEFNEKCGCYEASSFCAGFVYAIGLVRGWLTLLPEDPKRPRCKICGRDGITADFHFCIYDEEDIE